MREYPSNLGKGQRHSLVDHRKLILYTCRWCSVRLTGIRIQSTAGSVPCMRRRSAIVDLTVISSPHSGHGIRLQSLTWYKLPTLVHFRALASSDIPKGSAPGWHVIVRDLVKLAAKPYCRKRPTRTFSPRRMISPCHHRNRRLPGTARRSLPTRHEPPSGPPLS